MSAHGSRARRQPKPPRRPRPEDVSLLLLVGDDEHCDFCRLMEDLQADDERDVRP